MRPIKRQQGCHPAAGMSKSIERRRKSKDVPKLRGFKGKCQARASPLTAVVHVSKRRAIPYDRRVLIKLQLTKFNRGAYMK